MRLVVLVSGSGTNLQALLDACADPAYGAEVVAVGADRDGIEGLARAARAGVPTFVRRVGDYPSREDWDRALAEAVAEHRPDLVVSAGFMKLVSKDFLGQVRMVNTHPALCPAFPGMHGAADALAYGVKVTGATLFVVDGGVDTGPIVARSRAHPLQMVAGDLHGINTLQHQPAKIAAMEGHFETQAPAPLILFGMPNMAGGAHRVRGRDPLSRQPDPDPHAGRRRPAA